TFGGRRSPLFNQLRRRGSEERTIRRWVDAWSRRMPNARHSIRPLGDGAEWFALGTLGRSVVLRYWENLSRFPRLNCVPPTNLRSSPPARLSRSDAERPVRGCRRTSKLASSTMLPHFALPYSSSS